MHKATILGFVILLAAHPVTAQQSAYRWVDKDGVVHYSDQPAPGAEEVRLESAPSPGTRVSRGTTAARPNAVADTRQQESTAATFRYESLTVLSPAPEETLWNIGSVLNVTLDLKPGLQQGHQVRVYFDGEPRDVSGTQFQLEEVYRGAHNLQAEVVDANGKVKIRSQPRRFYVQQTSIQNPNKAN